MASLFHDILGSKLNRDYNVIIGAGYAYNSIRGDMGLDDNEEMRENVLGTSTTKFSGLEAFAEFRLKNIRAEFSYTVLDSSGQTPGLSGGRMVTTISFIGGFPVKLK